MTFRRRRCARCVECVSAGPFRRRLTMSAHRIPPSRRLQPTQRDRVCVPKPPPGRVADHDDPCSVVPLILSPSTMPVRLIARLSPPTAGYPVALQGPVEWFRTALSFESSAEFRLLAESPLLLRGISSSLAMTLAISPRYLRFRLWTASSPARTQVLEFRSMVLQPLCHASTDGYCHRNAHRGEHWKEKHTFRRKPPGARVEHS